MCPKLYKDVQIWVTETAPNSDICQLEHQFRHSHTGIYDCFPVCKVGHPMCPELKKVGETLPNSLRFSNCNANSDIAIITGIDDGVPVDFAIAGELGDIPRPSSPSRVVKLPSILRDCFLPY